MGKNFRVHVKEGREIVANTHCTVGLSDGSVEQMTTDGKGLLVLKAKVPGIVLWTEHKDAEGKTLKLYTSKINEPGKPQ
jgi:hypothetical protein